MEKVTVKKDGEWMIEELEWPTKGYKVKRTQLHQGFGIPGMTVETSMYESKGVKMLYRADGLFCESKGGRFIVPLADVVVCYE